MDGNSWAGVVGVTAGGETGLTTSIEERGSIGAVSEAFDKPYAPGAPSSVYEDLPRVSYEFDAVGMKVSELQNMKESVASYTKAVQDIIEKLNEEKAKANTAFRGPEIEAAVENYVEKSKEYCLNLVSYLNAFQDKLQNVANAWDQMQKTSADNMTETAAQGVGQAYTPGQV